MRIIMKMQIIIALLALVTIAHCVTFEEVGKYEWQLFKLTHKKEYQNKQEENVRLEIYRTNKHKIAKHMVRYLNGEVSFSMAINRYSDLLPMEIKKKMKGYKKRAENSTLLRSNRLEKSATFLSPAHVQLPRSVDWRRDGAVTPVKDQGLECGSCYTFAATGALEGQHFRKTGRLVSLSEQNLIDCSAGYENAGCDGGDAIQAFKYIRDNGGIDTEESYPYEGKEGTCRYDHLNWGATVTGIVELPAHDEHKLAHALATVGPIAVAIDASQDSFQSYERGVYYDENCSSADLDHAVLAVGYGTTREGLDYWLIKNSWGTDWGEAGYIRIARNLDNHCGTAAEGSYPLV